MRVNVYVSEMSHRFGLVPARLPISLPKDENWKYVWSGDTVELNLPEAVVEEIERRGFWTHRLFGDWTSRARAGL